jgi:hypothetical protein
MRRGVVATFRLGTDGRRASGSISTAGVTSPGRRALVKVVNDSTTTATTTVAATVTIAAVTPSQAAPGTTVPVTITGTGFAPGASVTLSGIGGTASTLALGGPDVTVSNITVTSPTQLTATLTIASTAPPGARNVIVANAAGGGSGMLPGGVTVTATPATLTLAYNGKLRDRVGQGETALGPDGALDGTLTATLSASSGRTISAP